MATSLTLTMELVDKKRGTTYPEISLAEIEAGEFSFDDVDIINQTANDEAEEKLIRNDMLALATVLGFQGTIQSKTTKNNKNYLWITRKPNRSVDANDAIALAKAQMAKKATPAKS